MKPFCAICTAEIVGVPSRQPLGRSDAMVNVCRGCDEDAPRAKCSDRGYVAGGSALGANAGIKKLASELGVPKQRGRQETSVVRTPGFVLVRIPSRDADGKPRDYNEARATFARQPWAASARYLSTSNYGTPGGYHLFERPAVVAVDVGDQVAELERFRVGGTR